GAGVPRNGSAHSYDSDHRPMVAGLQGRATPLIAAGSSPANDAYSSGLRLLPPRRWVKLPQGSLEVWEVAGAECLDPGGVVAIEPGLIARAARPRSGSCRTEPQPKVERVDRLGRRARGSIREWWLIKADGRRL